MSGLRIGRPRSGVPRAVGHSMLPARARSQCVSSCCAADAPARVQCSVSAESTDGGETSQHSDPLASLASTQQRQTPGEYALALQSG